MYHQQKICFFHTDHLGSTSYLTDSAGSVCQFVCYTPYGEAFVDEHSTTYENPFKFSGKELDDVTGLYDHWMRQRNPVTTLWLTPDPFFEQYTDYSPYLYCRANPVCLVDPTGLFDTEEQATNFGYDNNMNFRVIPMEGGGYEVHNEVDGKSYAYYGVLLDEVESVGHKAVPGAFSRAIDILIQLQIEQARQDAEKARLIYEQANKIDAVSVYAQVGGAMGFALNGEVEFGYMKKQGFFLSGSYGVGTGYDASASVGIKLSDYTHTDNPTIKSYEGDASSICCGLGPVDLGYSLSDDGKWRSGNLGWSFFSGTTFSSTFSHTNTYAKSLHK